MKAKLFTKDLIFIDIIDISSLSFKRQRNKEYTISCKPVANDDYNWEQVHFIYFLDDNEEKTKRIQYKPCGVLEGYNGDTLSIKSMESYLEKVSQVPENFTWWNNKRLENVVGDLCYGFRRIKKSTLTQMQDVVASNHVQFGTLEDGNGEVYADTGYYFSPSNIYELYYYSDGYVIYRITLPEEARRQGLVLRWSDQTGTTTDISVQFRWSNVSSDFSGVYSTEQSPLRGDNVRPNETSGIDIPESDNTYLFVKFNLKYDTGSTDTFVKGYNYEQEITTVEGEGGNKYVYYGKTAILRAFEVIYRVDTRIQVGDISVSETQLMQADLSNCDNLLSVLKAVSDAYGLTFFISFDNNVLSLNVYNEYINDTTNQTIITDKINSVTKRKDIKIDELQAVEAFGIGSGFDRIHTFVKAKDSETNIRNIGKYEGEETNEADLIVSAKEYIEKENEEISSASFEYYNIPLQVNDKVRVVIDKNVYTSLITEESYNFNGSKTEKEYTIGIRKYAFDGMFQSPFSGIYLYKPEKPSNLVATRKEEGWSVTWQGKTQKYLLQYKRSITSPWNTIFVNGTNIYIPYTEYDREYTFSVYAVDDRGIYSDAVYVFSNSLSEIIYPWETYNDSDSQPNTPTGEGNANGWHRNLTQEAKWMSKKESHRITEGTWSVPVLMPSAVKDGISTDIPDNVTGLTAVAMRDGIQIRCNPLSGGTKNIVNKYNFELLLEGSSTWISISSDTNSAFYTFDRSTIGYPEASAIDGSQVRCKVTNVYGYASLSYATAAVSIVGYGTWIPVKPSSLVIVAEEKSLTLRFNQVDGSNYYGSTIYTAKLSYSGTTRVEESGLRERFYVYDFNRSVDGYPEKTVIAGSSYLGNYSLLVTATDMISGKTNVSNTATTIDSSNYGTWIPTAPTIFNMQSGNRSIVVGWQIPLSSGIYIYGLRFYEIQISKDGTNWYKPETAKTGKVSESDWYNGTGQVRVSGVQFAQSLPLTGQTLGLPVNTTYYYRVRTIGVTDSYISAWSYAQSGVALATGIGDIIAGAVTEQILAPDAVTYEKLNVLAVNKINSFVKGKNDYWTTSPDAGTKNCTIEVDAETGLQCGVLSSNLNEVTNSNKFEVLPDDIFEVNITFYKNVGIGTTYIGLQSFAETPNWNCQYANYNTIAKSWGTFNNSSNFYFLTTNGTTNRLTLKTYIVGYNVTPDRIPAPNIATACARMLPGQTKANLRILNYGNAGTTTKLYILAPRVINIASGQLLAKQIVTPSLSAIAANIGEITSGILRSVTKAGESKPNVSLDLDTEEFRVGNNPSLEDSNDPDAEYLHWIPNIGLFLKLKNLVVDAIASTIRGRFRVRGTTAIMAQSVLIVNPESTLDPDTDTPANTTQVKQSVIANNVKLVTPLTGWWNSWNVLQHLESSAHGAIAWLNSADGNGWLIGMHSDGRFTISRLTSKTTGYHLLTITDTKEIQLDSKKAIGFADAFLRLNDTNAFTSGIWLGSSNLNTAGEIGIGSSGASSTARIRIIPGAHNGANGIVINGATGNINALGGFTGNLTGNADTATLATQANEIKPLGNSITLPASATSTTKIIKIATVDYIWAGNIKISVSGGGVADNVSLQFGQRADINGVKVTYSKYASSRGISTIIVTRDGADGGAPRNIYIEFANYPNYSQTITLGVVEKESGSLSTSMTEVASVAGTVLDSVSLSYQRGEISSYQHVFTKNIIGNVTGNLTGNVTGNVTGNLTGNVTGNVSGSSSNVDSANFFLNEDAAYVNLHTKNAKPLYLNAVNAAAYLYANLINLGNSGQKVGILTANTSMHQPDSTYPVSIGENVHMNNKTVDNACRFNCNNNGNGDISITTERGQLPGFPNAYYPIIKTSNSALDFSLGNVHAFGLGSASGTTTLYSGANTKMNSQSPFYGAVGNDICDNIKIESPVKDFKYGYCYCELNGEYKKGNRGIIGITSDTASLHCGSDDGMEAGKDYLPIAIGGFVLAFVDKKYRRGTPLKAKKDGSLTRAYWFTPCWKILATYQEVPREETWNKAKVNGRVIVRVK